MVQTYKPYWIENTSKLWSKMSFAGAGTYDVYVKLASGQTPSIDDTMVLGDDFSGGLDTEKWGTPTGTSPLLEVVDGELHVYTGSYRGSCEVYSIPTFSVENTITKAMIRSSTNSSFRNMCLRTSVDSDNHISREIQSNHNYKNGNRLVTRLNGVDDIPQNSYYMSSVALQEYSIKNITNNIDGKITGTSGGDSLFSVSNNLSGNAKIGFLIMDDYGSSGMYVDYVYVRKYAATPPLVSEPTIIDENTLKYTITTYGALTDYQVGFDIPPDFLSSTTESVQVSFSESIPPVIVYEDSTEYTSNTTKTIYAEVTDESALSTVTLQKNSETPITMTKVTSSLNVYEATVDIDIGYNYLQIYAEDEWGNSTTSTTKTVIGISDAADNRPLVTLVGTYPSTTTENSLTVTATVETDDFQYAKIINLSVAGAYEMTATANPNEYSGTVPLVYGDNLIHIEAMGSTGWYGKSETITVTRVDSSAETTIRGITTATNITYAIDEFIANGITKEYDVTETPLLPKPLIKVNDITVDEEEYTINYSTGHITFATAPTIYSPIKIIYLYGNIQILPNSTIKILRTNGQEVSTISSNSDGTYETTIYGDGSRDIQMVVENEKNAKINVELGG